MRGDVVDGLPDGRDLLGILVRDLDPELVLELHDELDEVERVGVQVVLERRLFGDLILFDSELLRQNFLDTLEDFFTRRCHVTSSLGGFGKDVALNAVALKPRDHTLTRSGNRSESRSTTRWSAPRAASRIAFAIAARPELPCAITARPRRPSR